MKKGCLSAAPCRPWRMSGSREDVQIRRGLRYLCARAAGEHWLCATDGMSTLLPRLHRYE